ncbi:RluA family pseudouridine synthase [Tumebacillus permanentifrigoris]|uniref:RNA pseudouridylate synthase n=1 Tax=Tumebacillus permanentifrigoris TaxID=378543 RepID=A0A316DR28_9BACL|nr:RluA family pseudouridine synthase [Tumebacillus permanentifrigoris]PWK06625.1 RluA family pseudouridine synthase [Tumebacillus permanentifrigoris]
MRDELARLAIGEDLAGLMVKDVLRDRFEMSRKIIRKLVEGQGVLVNGEHVWLTWRLRAGDELRLLLPVEESEDILPEPIPFRSVYEDEDVLVIDKPAGLIVHPTTGHWTGTLANGVVYDWKLRGVSARFRPVHRIDQHSSGLIVVAKNHYAHKLLGEQMKQRTVERLYEAVIHGVMEEARGLVDAPIERSDEDRRVRKVRKDGQEARTAYRVLERYPFADPNPEEFIVVPGGQIKPGGTRVELKLFTGRTHQIRVHMQHLGYPLFGDAMYYKGDDSAWIERQALHAKLLGFEHPRTKEWMRFQSPLPNDMEQLVERLRAGDTAGGRGMTGGGPREVLHD